MQTIRRFIGTTVFLLTLQLVASGTPQPERPSTGTQPTGGVRELVDFMALADDGRPITDLNAADVTFKLDGRIREIRSLEYVELASADGEDRVGPLVPPMASPYSSNRLADAGRTVMIVINHESIRAGRERPARDAALKFLKTLSSRDQVGLVTMPHGRVETELTRDHETVKEALLRITGQAQQTRSLGLPALPRRAAVSPEEAATSERACNARLTLNTLTGLLESLAGTDGPKSLVFISTGLAPPTRDAPAVGPPGQCELRTAVYEEVATAASAARAHFYVIQPNDEQPDPASNAFVDPTASRFGTADENLMGLQHLAGVTGGELFRLSSQNPDAVFTRVSYESSGYYTIAFEPEAFERNGQPHRVEIRVARDRVLVRSSPSLVLPKLEGGDLTPQKMLRAARSFRELPLRAAAYASRMPGETMLKIVAAGEPMDPAVKLKAAAVGLFDARGKLVAQTSADARDLTTMPLIVALPATMGAYRLRLAAIDVTGHHGTVDTVLRADLTSAAPLKISDLALGIANRGAFVPRLLFAREPTAIALLDLYGSPRSSTEITVKLELAMREDGPPLVVVPGAITVTPEGDTRHVQGTLPIVGIGPGDYVVRAIVNVDGKTAGTVYRTLRKAQM